VILEDAKVIGLFHHFSVSVKKRVSDSFTSCHNGISAYLVVKISVSIMILRDYTFALIRGGFFELYHGCFWYSNQLMAEEVRFELMFMIFLRLCIIELIMSKVASSLN